MYIVQVPYVAATQDRAKQRRKDESRGNSRKSKNIIPNCEKIRGVMVNGL